MSLNPEELKNKVKCPKRRPYCVNKANFVVLHEHLPDIDGEVFYHILCLDCGQQFSLESKEIYARP